MKVKLTTMCMITSGNEILVQERTKKDWPGITFPGGKVEENESIYESCIREVKEETGLEVTKLKACGIVHYEFTNNEERWIIFLYKTEVTEKKLSYSDKEDDVYWITIDEFNKLTLANDLESYLILFRNEDRQEIYAKWNGSTSENLKIR